MWIEQLINSVAGLIEPGERQNQLAYSSGSQEIFNQYRLDVRAKARGLEEPELPYITYDIGDDIEIVDQSVIDNINQNIRLKTDIFQHILNNFIYNPVLATKIINEIDKDVLDNLREVLKVCGNNEFPEFLPFIHIYTLCYSITPNHVPDDVVENIRNSLNLHDSEIFWNNLVKRYFIVMGTSTLISLGLPMFCAPIVGSIVHIIISKYGW